MMQVFMENRKKNLSVLFLFNHTAEQMFKIHFITVILFFSTFLENVWCDAKLALCDVTNLERQLLHALKGVAPVFLPI